MTIQQGLSVLIYDAALTEWMQNINFFVDRIGDHISLC